MDKPTYKPGFQIHDSFLVRIAGAPYEHYTGRSTQAWVDDPYFRKALLLASASLYLELQRVDFNIELLPAAADRSVRKYINRITRRTVPFGAFAGFAMTQFSAENIQLKDDFRLHMQHDLRDILAAYKEQPQDAHNRAYQTNPTLYHLFEETRFVGTDIGKDGEINFSLRSLPKDDLVRQITGYCRQKRSAEEIRHFFNRAGLGSSESLVFINELATEQVLLPETHPVVTEDNPVGYTLNRQQVTDFGRDDQNQYPFSRRQWYANLQFQCSGGLPHAVKSDLEDSLFVLRRIFNTVHLSDLNNFKTMFVRRFGESFVPLMNALDPEIGVSYAGLSKSARGMALLEGIERAQSPEMPARIPWGSVQRLLLNNWPQCRGEAINLVEKDLMPLQENEHKLPPGLSVLFRYEEGKLWMDNCGGASATQIAGRFSSFSSGVKEVLKHVAAQEELANPGVVFAEIVSLSEGKADNVNRRAILRRYEIPITAGSILPQAWQIPPSSLMVAVVNDEVVLWSPDIGKRVIPRLSSAYNHRRSTLPLLRFLGDLQYQGLQYQWSADLAAFLPGLNWYPRLTYRNVILSPATWVLDAAEIKAAGANGFNALAESVQLPRYVAIGEGDRYLSLDLKSMNDLSLLASECPAEGRLVLRELPQIHSKDGTVTNMYNQTHAAQFNVFMTTPGPAYRADIFFPSNQPLQPLLPGRPWLYYKLYMPNGNSEQLLIKLYPVIKSLLGTGHVNEWFYVRYLDPDPHLRLRLKVAENSLEATVRELSALFETLYGSGQLHRLTMEPYEPEHIRYLEIGMRFTESIFTASSNFVLAGLRQAGFQHHLFAIRSTYDSLKQLVPNQPERFKLIENIRDQLFKEENSDKIFKKWLERKKREMRVAVAGAIENADLYRSLRCQRPAKRYLRILNNMSNKKGIHLLQLSADLCHMHINRCFPADMRRQELVLYTLLHQYELTLYKKATS